VARRDRQLLRERWSGVDLDGARLRGSAVARRVEHGASSHRDRCDEEAIVSDCKVQDVMTTDVITVPPDCDVESIAELLIACNISGVPVVDGDGCLLGVVSKTDLLRTRGGRDCQPASAFDPRCEDPRPARTARDIMTTFGFTLRGEVSVKAAAALLAYEGVHRAPVVGANGRIIGIFSTLDLARAVACS
jgi:CBS domain-containing protein